MNVHFCWRYEGFFPPSRTPPSARPPPAPNNNKYSDSADGGRTEGRTSGQSAVKAMGSRRGGRLLCALHPDPIADQHQPQQGTPYEPHHGNTPGTAAHHRWVPHAPCPGPPPHAYPRPPGLTSTNKSGWGTEKTWHWAPVVLRTNLSAFVEPPPPPNTTPVRHCARVRRLFGREPDKPPPQK